MNFGDGKGFFSSPFLYFECNPARKKSSIKKSCPQCADRWTTLSAKLLEPVVRLYALTEKPEYLEFAGYIIGLGGTDVANLFDLAYDDDFYPYQYPVTKAYEMTSCFKGLLEYYFIKGGKDISKS